MAPVPAVPAALVTPLPAVAAASVTPFPAVAAVFRISGLTWLTASETVWPAWPYPCTIWFAALCDADAPWIPPMMLVTILGISTPDGQSQDN